MRHNLPSKRLKLFIDGHQQVEWWGGGLRIRSYAIFYSTLLYWQEQLSHYIVIHSSL